MNALAKIVQAKNLDPNNLTARHYLVTPQRLVRYDYSHRLVAEVAIRVVSLSLDTDSFAAYVLGGGLCLDHVNGLRYEFRRLSKQQITRFCAFLAFLVKATFKGELC